MMRTPPPATTSDETPATASSPTTVTAMSLQSKSFTTEVTAHINQPELQEAKTQKDGQTPLSEGTSLSGKSTPSRHPTPEEQRELEFSEMIKYEPPEAYTYFRDQMRKISQKVIDFKAAISRMKTEVRQSCPDAEKAEILMRSVEETFKVIEHHRKDAVSKFSMAARLADPFMEEKRALLKEAEEEFLTTYTLISLQGGRARAETDDKQPSDKEELKELEKRNPTPSLFDIGFHPLDYMGENRKLEALEPPGLTSTFMQEDREDYRLLTRKKQLSRPPPPPPKQQGIIPLKSLAAPQLTVQQPTGGRPIHVCQICLTDQQTSEGLDRHIDAYHGRQNVGPPLYPQTYLHPVPPNQGQWYTGQPNQGQWYPGPAPQNQGMDMKEVLKMMAEIMSQNDEKNREEQKRQHEHRLYEQRQMAQMNFEKDIEFRCNKFNPNAHKEEGKKIAAYGKFRTQIRELAERMENLDMTEAMKYEILKGRVQEDALDLISKTNPTNSTFNDSLIKLDKQYLSKSIEIRDLYHQLKNIPRMHETQSKQVSKTVHAALNVVEQLMAHQVEGEDVWFLLCSEMLVPKLNTIAQKMWEEVVEKKTDETRPWGHKLKVEDLTSVLQKVKTKMYNREISASYSREPAKEDKKQGQGQGQGQQANQKKKEEEERRKNTLYGQQTKTEGTFKSGMPVDKSKPDICPVPLCEASNQAKKNKKGKYSDTDVAHCFVLNCPKLKTMSNKEKRQFYSKNNCTCLRCFSTLHKYDECPLQASFPKKCDVIKPDGTECGGKHHHWLHNDKKENNRSQQTVNPDVQQQQ